MPTPLTARWPKPKSEDEFEDIVLEALKIRWRDRNASRNGRRGQRQHGIDIVGRANHKDGFLVGAQCKNTESPMLQHVVEEVAKARSFRPSLTEFLFVTVADRDAKLQEQVREHFEAHPAPFRVEIVFWDDILHEIGGDPGVVAKHWQGWKVASSAPSVPLTSPGEIRLHVLAKTIEAPDYAPARVILRFSITNLSIEPVKLECVPILVDIQAVPRARCSRGIPLGFVA